MQRRTFTGLGSRPLFRFSSVTGIGRTRGVQYGAEEGTREANLVVGSHRMTSVDERLVARIIAKLDEPPVYAEDGQRRTFRSLLRASAAQFGSRPEHEEHTQPSGFDPRGAVLFEAIVESAYLVATADDDFDEDEQQVFRHIVSTVCAGTLTEQQVSALMAAFEERLLMQGRKARMLAVVQAMGWCGEVAEAIRVAALMAEASGGVSAEERAVLEELSGRLSLPPQVLQDALEEVRGLRSSSGSASS